MSCVSCAGSVQNIFSSGKGVKTALVNFSSNSIFVEYDSNLTGFRELDESLRGSGYTLVRFPVWQGKSSQTVSGSNRPK